jgi:ProP effector
MFQGRRRPLKIGIRLDISEGLIEAKLLSLALERYTRNTGYLKALKPAAARIDLHGNPVGEVSERDARGAQGLLALRWKREREKRAARQQAERAARKAAQQAAREPENVPKQPDGLAALKAAAQQRKQQSTAAAAANRSGSGRDPGLVPQQREVAETG